MLRVDIGFILGFRAFWVFLGLRVFWLQTVWYKLCGIDDSVRSKAN